MEIHICIFFFPFTKWYHTVHSLLQPSLFINFYLSISVNFHFVQYPDHIKIYLVGSKIFLVADLSKTVSRIAFVPVNLVVRPFKSFLDIYVNIISFIKMKCYFLMKYFFYPKSSMMYIHYCVCLFFFLKICCKSVQSVHNNLMNRLYNNPFLNYQNKRFQ